MRTPYLLILLTLALFSTTTFAEPEDLDTTFAVYDDTLSTTSTSQTDTLKSSDTNQEGENSQVPENTSVDGNSSTTAEDTTSIQADLDNTLSVETKPTDDETATTSDSTNSPKTSNTKQSVDERADKSNKTQTKTKSTELNTDSTLPLSDRAALITDKKDIKKLKKIAFLPKETTGTFVLKKETSPLENKDITYTLNINNTKKWGITVSTPNPLLEEILLSYPKEKKTSKSDTVSKNHKKKAKKSKKKEWHRLTNSNLPQKYGVDYHHTPWTKMKPFWRTDTLPRGLLSWFDWETGGTLELRRDQFYNFRREGDTLDDNIDLMKPTLVGYNLELSYRHKIKFFYVGGGITRNNQDSRSFDTLFTENENWMQRMGWQLHVAVPGFKYEIYRDPRLIPEYGCHDRKVFSNLYENNAFEHEFLYKIHAYESTDTLGWDVDTFVVPIDTILNGEFISKGTLILDSTAQTRGLWIPPGIGHKFSVKVGYFNYTLLLDPYRYRAPIQTYMLKNLPFFNANWDMGLIVLPNGRVIPTGAVDFYTFRIPIKGHGLRVTPLRLTFQIASRREFYVGLSFKSEFKPNFSKKNKERAK